MHRRRHTRISVLSVVFWSAVLSLGLVSTAAGQASAPSEQTDVERVVRTLVALEPTDLRNLEAVLGPLNRDPSIWEEAIGPLTRQRVSPGIGLVRVSFDIDPYRQEPREIDNPALASYEIVAQVGEKAASEMLRDHLGKPRRIRYQGGEMSAYGRFYLDALAEDRFRLLWYAEEPEFAIPPRSRGEEERLIRGLGALFADGFDRKTLIRRLGRLEKDPQEGCEAIHEDSWQLEACPDGAEVFDRLSFRFRPPLPGDEVVQALGVERPVVVSTDSRELGRVVADRNRGLPVLRGYSIEISIRDEGLEPLGEPVHGLPAWRPTGGLQIERLEIEHTSPR